MVAMSLIMQVSGHQFIHSNLERKLKNLSWHKIGALMSLLLNLTNKFSERKLIFQISKLKYSVLSVPDECNPRKAFRTHVTLITCCLFFWKNMWRRFWAKIYLFICLHWKLRVTALHSILVKDFQKTKTTLRKRPTWHSTSFNNEQKVKYKRPQNDMH